MLLKRHTHESDTDESADAELSRDEALADIKKRLAPLVEAINVSKEKGDKYL